MPERPMSARDLRRMTEDRWLAQRLTGEPKMLVAGTTEHDWLQHFLASGRARMTRAESAREAGQGAGGRLRQDGQ